MEHSSALKGLTVVLYRPKFPENIGSTARACANLGCPNLSLVQPQSWDLERAQALATRKGKLVLEGLAVFPSLPQALSQQHLVYGTTVRTGGWRKAIKTPEQVAPKVGQRLQAGHRVAVVFGPEDQGLSNQEIDICGQLLTIPTAAEASSLNLSQAVLIILYELFKASSMRRFRPSSPRQSAPCNHAEQEILFQTIKETLGRIGFLKGDNPAYWMLPVRRFGQRLSLYRHEFNLLMGICRQIDWLARQTEKTGGTKDTDLDDLV
jgi:tRNA/rRNA methyltransferase